MENQNNDQENQENQEKIKTQKIELDVTDAQAFYVCCFFLGQYYSEDPSMTQEIKDHSLVQIKKLYKILLPETRLEIKKVEKQVVQKTREETIVNTIQYLENELIKTNENKS